MTKYNNIRDMLLTLMALCVGFAIILVCVIASPYAPNWTSLFGFLMYVMYMWLFNMVLGDIYMSTTYVSPDLPEPGIPNYK